MIKLKLGKKIEYTYISILQKILIDQYDKNANEKSLSQTGKECKGSNLCSVLVTKGSKVWVRYTCLADILFRLGLMSDFFFVLILSYND